jgi:hypothetical protein
MNSPFYAGEKFTWRDATLIAFGSGLFIYLLPMMFAQNHWWTLRAKLLGTFLSDLVISVMVVDHSVVRPQALIL